MDPNSGLEVFDPVFLSAKEAPPKQKNSPFRNSTPKTRPPNFNPESCQKVHIAPLQGLLSDKRGRREGDGNKKKITTIYDILRQFPSLSPIKQRQVTDLDVTDLGFSGPGILFCATGALWGRVTPFPRSLF